MAIYYTLAFITVMIAHFSGNKTEICYKNIELYSQTPKRIKLWIAYIVPIIFIVISGLRYNVGADYLQYASNYNFYKNYTFNLGSFFDEPGIRIIAKISGIIYDDYVTLFFLASLITIGLIFLVLIKESDNYALSVALFMFMGTWTTSFNAVRQCLAAAVIFFGYRYIIDKKFIKWVLIIFVASLFHMTAWVVIFFYFLANRKIDVKQLILCILATFLLLGSYDLVWRFLEGYKEDETLSEMIYANHGVNILRVVVAWAPIALYFGFCNKDFVKDKRNNFFVNMSLINALLVTASSNSAYFARVAIYSETFNAISIPLMLNYINNKNDKKILASLAMILYFIYYIFVLYNTAEVEFFWIWQR